MENWVYERRKSLVYARKSMIDFYKAYQNVHESFYSPITDLNNYACGHYPFDKSFDELEISDWVFETTKEIDKDLFNFEVCIINNNEIVHQSINFIKYMDDGFQSNYDDYIDMLSSCQELALGHVNAVVHEEFSSGTWIIIKLDEGGF